MSITFISSEMAASVGRGCKQLTNKTDLQTLVTWLEAKQPASYRVLGHLRSRLCGLSSSDVIVNEWPQPSVVIVKPSSSTAQQSLDSAHNEYTVYATEPGACKDALLKDGVMDWTRPWGIGALDSRLRGPLHEVAQRFGGTLLDGKENCCIMHISPENLKKFHVELPQGYYHSRLTPLQASTIAAMWPYRKQGTEDYIQCLMTKLPSVCVRLAATGAIVGWTLIQDDHSIGMIHVMPAHRNKGIGQYLVKAMADNLVKEGSPVYAHIVKSNVIAQDMNESLGFQKVEDMDTTWMSYTPPKHQEMAITV